MGALNRYSGLILKHKIAQLAEAIVRSRSNLSSVLLEASLRVDGTPFNSVLSALNEDDTRGWGWHKRSGDNYVAHQKYLQSKWDDYNQRLAAEQPPEEEGLPDNVDELTEILGHIVRHLFVKYNMTDQQIGNIIDQALRGIGKNQVTMVGAQHQPPEFGGSADTGYGEIDPELAKRFGTTSFTGMEEEPPTSGTAPPAVPPEAPKKKASVPTKPAEKWETLPYRRNATKWKGEGVGRRGNVLQEWCHLAGIKKRGR